MRKLNKVNKLNKTSSHRKAMLGNMVTSLLENERITTTKQKAKVVRSLTEKMITKAKKNLKYGDQESEKALHNKRVVMKTIKDRDVIAKLFNDIAVRNKDRNGGYTRIYLLGERRAGDAAEQAIIELVERPEVKAKNPDAKKDDKAKAKKPVKAKKTDKAKTDKEKPAKSSKAKTEKGKKEEPKKEKKTKTKEK